MTETQQHSEPTRAEIVIFVEDLWRKINMHEEAAGHAANEYELTRIRRGCDTLPPMWVIDFLYHYNLEGLHRTVYGYYIITQEPRSGKLWFVRWDELKEQAE